MKNWICSLGEVLILCGVVLIGFFRLADDNSFAIALFGFVLIFIIETVRDPETTETIVRTVKKDEQQYEIDCLRESKIELEKNFEKLLHELRDRDIVNWWLNGEGYHWEFNEDVRRKYGKEK